jgi:cytochrome c biogenesis protein CcmG/thiol:disulfide interchange protein DsbE
MLDRWINRNWIAFSILVLTVGAAWIWVSRPSSAPGAAGQPAPMQGFMAPGFTSTTFAGELVDLAGFKGKVVLINFWASWCPPCRAEMQAIQNAYADYRDQGLVVLAINASYQDDIQAATGFAQTEGLTFPLLTDPDGSINRTYRVLALPTTFFIDRQGRIAKVVIGGPMAEALVRSQVEALLKETP